MSQESSAWRWPHSLAASSQVKPASRVPRVELPSSHCKFTYGHYAKQAVGKAVKIVTILTIINRFLVSGSQKEVS